jgi:hypothetical protein
MKKHLLSALLLFLLLFSFACMVRGGGKYITVEAGMTIGSLHQELGIADNYRILQNICPQEMGLIVYTYNASEKRIKFDLQNGDSRYGSSIDMVLDPNGKVMRLSQNPNPIKPRHHSVQRGLPGYIVRALVPLRTCKD